MLITLRLRTVVTFAAGLAVALVAVFVFRAWPAGAAAGDIDTTFVPIFPCRLVDTRPGADHLGPLATFGPNQTQLSPRTNSGHCPSLPATALELNVTAIGATEPTFITVWNDSGSRPLTSSLNPTPGEPPTTNAVTVKLYDGHFAIYNLAGNVDLVIDVTGYYTPASLKDLASRVTILEDNRTKSYSDFRSEPNTVGDEETVAQFLFTTDFEGTLMLNYEVLIDEPDIGESVSCHVSPPDSFSAPEEVWVSSGSSGQLTGMRVVTPGLVRGQASFYVQLVCSSTDAATITKARLTGIWVPH